MDTLKMGRPSLQKEGVVQVRDLAEVQKERKTFTQWDLITVPPFTLLRDARVETKTQTHLTDFCKCGFLNR